MLEKSNLFCKGAFDGKKGELEENYSRIKEEKLNKWGVFKGKFVYEDIKMEIDYYRYMHIIETYHLDVLLCFDLEKHLEVC